MTTFEEQVRAREEAFWEAENGIGDVPDYTVSADPADGGFVVLHDPDLCDLDRARVGGDVSRRFMQQAAGELGDADPFAGRRVPWPYD